MHPEMRQGYDDAKDDFSTMLSCQKCRAEAYLAATKGTVGEYGRGWRLFCMNHHNWEHECLSKVNDGD